MDSKQRGRPKDAEKADAILQAAGEAFTQNGLNHTTMQDIAKNARVSKYTVYNHFGSKEDLFETVIRNKCATHMSDELLQKAFTQSPIEGLYSLGFGFVEIIYSEEALAIHRTIMAESRHDNTIAKLFYQSGPEQAFNKLSAYLDYLEKNNICRFKNIERACEIFFSLFTGVTHMKTVLKTEDKPTVGYLKKMTQENVDIFMKIFGV